MIYFRVPFVHALFGKEIDRWPISRVRVVSGNKNSFRDTERSMGFKRIAPIHGCLVKTYAVHALPGLNFTYPLNMSTLTEV